MALDEVLPTTKGECILVRDRIEADGSFLLHYYSSAFLKQDHPVCFVSFTQTKQHCEAIGRKLGCKSNQSKRLFFVTPTDTDELDDLLKMIQAFVEQQTEEQRVCIIVDDWNMIETIWNSRAAVQFYRDLRQFTFERNGSHTLVSLRHGDCDTRETTYMGHVLADLASLMIDTKGFDSGYITDVHGLMIVKSLSSPDPAVKLHFKLLENGIKCFPVGESARY